MDEYGYGFSYGGGRVLLHSQSCKKAVESGQSGLKPIKVLGIIVDVVLCLIVLRPIVFILIGSSFRHSFDIYEWFRNVLLILFFWYIPWFLISNKLIKPVYDYYDKYIGYCEKENLIVNEEAIYGATTQLPFHIGYDQIVSVSIHNNSDHVFKQSVANDILCIEIKSRQQYSFFSFTNSRELKFMIEEQMKKYGWTSPKTPPKLRQLTPSSEPRFRIAYLDARSADEFVCPDCGTIQPPNSNFCRHCGTIFVFDSDKSKNAPSSAHVGSQANFLECPNCGCKQNPRRRSCFQCGCEFIFDE